MGLWDPGRWPIGANLTHSRESTKAAERRQTIAHGVSRGGRSAPCAIPSPGRGGRISAQIAGGLRWDTIFRPSGARGIRSLSLEPTAHAVTYFLPALRAYRGRTL